MNSPSKQKKPKKTDNMIQVLLGDDPGTLEIDDCHVHKNAIRQTIVWKLAKSLEAGNFLGFQWKDPGPPADTFDPPEISPDGNSLAIGDHHAHSKSEGDFGYTLTVEFGGNTYTSEPNPPTTNTMAMMVKGPIIINR